jgi:hypothetical protein
MICGNYRPGATYAEKATLCDDCDAICEKFDRYEKHVTSDIELPRFTNSRSNDVLFRYDISESQNWTDIIDSKSSDVHVETATQVTKSYLTCNHLSIYAMMHMFLRSWFGTSLTFAERLRRRLATRRLSLRLCDDICGFAMTAILVAMTAIPILDFVRCDSMRCGNPDCEWLRRGLRFTNCDTCWNWKGTQKRLV